MQFPGRMKPHAPGSLRKRYFSMTLFLGFTVIGVVLYFFIDTFITKHKITIERSKLQSKIATVNQVSRNRLDIFSNIQQFLLDPTIGYFDKKAFQLISDSKKINDDLQLQLSPDDHEINEISATLKILISRLHSNTSDLFNSRLDVNRQYPGLALAANEMTDPQQRVNNYLQILIAEIESGDLEPESDELLNLLMKAKILWVNQISQYRIYLANRFASFSTDFLRSQASSLKDLNEKFIRDIEKLGQIYATEDSFEGEEAIQIIKHSARQWHQFFEAVRKLHESNAWRTDNLLLQQNLIPLINEISLQLKAMESIFQRQESTIDTVIQENTTTLFILLATIIFLFLLFIAIILVSLDRMVFQPLQMVSNVLKSNTFNYDSLQIKMGKAREINDLITAFHEMGEKVNQRQNELEHQALHDSLTALPNRFMLNQRLDYQLLTAERSEQNFTLFFMDLDNFKDVNDTLGHATGDELLLQVAKRLLKGIRKSDTVARLGGDEFAILLPEVDRNESEKLAIELHESVTKPFIINDKTISVGISIGIAHYPDDGVDTVTLLQHADIAMYMAKRSRYAFSHYDKTSDFYSHNRLVLIQDLPTAISNNELMLYFQPQLTCSDNDIFGAEALIRWNHPEFGFINPEKIIEIAEYSGKIHLLTLWVLEHAIAECRLWHDNKYPINISANLSIQDFNNQLLCDQVEALLKKYQLDAHYLTLEITESGMMENPALSIDILNKFKDMGVKLSVDDFGTGFSSLKYLKQLPVDELKIDKSFVLEMDKNENDRVIVQSTIQLGHNLGLKVVAEGIEHETLLKIVDSFGCDYAQGYLFERPLNGINFLEYLDKNQHRISKVV